MSYSLDDPPNSRLFVVAGRNTSSDFLRSVFEQYGPVSFVKYLRDKGVAYVKYERASSAALAIESLHEVTLNDGHGPRLKVMLAESPHTSRALPGIQVRRPEEDAALDPDNTPPRSRLFMVVPKSAEGSVIEAEMSRFSGLQYCKTDLIASKGIVFVKYSTSSSAFMAMETVQMAGSVAGYKVKIMLAEPKSRRSDSLSAFMPGMQGARGGLGQHGHPGNGFPSAGMQSQLLPPLSASLLGPGMGGLQDFSSLQSAMGSLTGGFSQGLSSLGTQGLDVSQLGGQQGLGPGGFGSLGNLSGDLNYMNLGAFAGLGLSHSMLSGGGGSGGDLMNAAGHHHLHSLDAGQGGHHQYQQQQQQQGSTPEGGGPNCRLFIVVHKSVTDDALASLFHCFHGLDYVDLKRDRLTGRSKGYAYVNYASPEAAAVAQGQLNGIEYPPGSGCRMKVLFAEPLSMQPSRSEEAAVAAMAAADTFPGNAARAAMMGSSSQDTASTAFQLPSPNSGDSVAHAGGMGGGGQQHSARTDLSSASHDSMLSPHSSPLRMNSGVTNSGHLDASLDSVHAGLGGLSLGLSLTNNNNNNNGPGAAARPQSLASPHTTSRGSGEQSDSGDAATGTWRETSPDHLTATSAALAVGSLNGVEVLGEALRVRSSPPIALRAPGAGIVGMAGSKTP